MKRFSLLTASCILLLVVAFGCGKQVFNGNFTANDTQLKMDYTILNKTETHVMELKEGWIINADIENKSGRLDILVTDEDGQEIYRGDNASTGKFSIEIQKAGKYKFSVKGSKAKGSVSFEVSE